MAKQKNFDGFSFIEALIILVVFVLLCGGAYLVWKRQNNDSNTTFTSAPSTPCEGEWYDTHTHLDDMEFSTDIAKQMRANNIGCSVIFTHLDLDDIDNSLLEIREEFSPNPGRFVLFADVIANNVGSVSRQKLDSVWKEYPDVFKGIGENAFYREPLVGTSLQAEPWPIIFEFAAVHDVFVMLHLTANEVDDLEAMLEKYPDTKVLLHHRELFGQLSGLMQKYENLYYTLDTTNLTTVTATGSGVDEVLFFPNENTASSADRFLSKLRENRANLLAEATRDWTGLFDVAPDRIFWGTDVALDWHVNKDVYAELISLSTDFVASLPEQVRNGYIHGNALKAFGGGSTLQPLTDAEFDQLDADTEN